MYKNCVTIIFTVKQDIYRSLHFFWAPQNNNLKLLAIILLVIHPQDWSKSIMHNFIIILSCILITNNIISINIAFIIIIIIMHKCYTSYHIYHSIHYAFFGFLPLIQYTPNTVYSIYRIRHTSYYSLPNCLSVLIATPKTPIPMPLNIII